MHMRCPPRESGQSTAALVRGISRETRSCGRPSLCPRVGKRGSSLLLCAVLLRFDQLADFRDTFRVASAVDALASFGSELDVHRANAFELILVELLEIHEHVVSAG